MINEFQPMNHLSRLQNFICTIGNLPTSYVISMSYEEQVWWLCNFLETKIFPALETNTEITEETQKAFLELQQYVTDYFNNLDVQDEINNKLDEMLEDGTLQDIIDNYIRDVEFVFPRGYENTNSGSWTVIKVKNKNIMIDTFLNSKWDDLRTDLLNNGISHIDYLIITHFDSDHYGNFANLVSNGFIDVTTEIIAHHMDNAWQSIVPESYTNYENFLQIISTNNLNRILPTENYEVTIGQDFKFRINNTNTSYYLTHPNGDGHMDYNDTSLFISIFHNNVSALFPGDAGKTSFSYLFDNNYINRKYNLFMIEHHGNNTLANSPTKQMLEILNPDICVKMCGVYSANLGQPSGSSSLYLSKINKKIISTCYQKNNVIITSDGNNFNVKEASLSNTNNGRVFGFTFYVDKNSTDNEIPDGTQEHPFREINQAILAIPQNYSGFVNINVAEGTYGDRVTGSSIFNNKDGLNLNGFNNTVTITATGSKENTIIRNSLIAYNISNLIVSGFTFKIKSLMSSIVAYGSKLVIKNCDFTNDNNENSLVYDCLYGVNSTIDISNCSFNKYKNVYNINENCLLFSSYNNISNCQCFINSNSSRVSSTQEILDENTITEKYKLDSNSTTLNPLVIYEDWDNANRPIEIDPVGFDNFSQSVRTFLIEYCDAQNNCNSVEVRRNATNVILLLVTLNAAMTVEYKKFGEVSLANNKFTFNKYGQISTVLATGEITKNTENNYIKINRISIIK